MAFKISDCDNIRESFTAANSATVPLGGAMANSNAATSKLSNGDTSWWVVRNGAEFSEGIFTLTTGSPNTLTQTLVFKSSNGNAAVTFSSGTGEAYIDVPARVLDALNLIEITVTSAATTDIGAADGENVVVSGTTGPITSLGATTINKKRRVRHSGSVYTHNATSLILIGGVNWTSNVNDISIFQQDNNGYWREIVRQYADGRVVGGAVSGTTGTFSGALSATTGTFSGAVQSTTLTPTSGQIIFPATQNASAGANTLDDYEEGTYTPTFTPAGGSWTTSSATGVYTKVGNLCFARAIGTITAFNTGSGFANIGLPFSAAQTGTAYGRETLNTGKTLNGEHSANATVTFAFYDNTNTAGANNVYRVGCTFVTG